MKITTKTQRHEGLTKAMRAALCGLRVFVSLWFVFLFGVPGVSAGALDDNLQSALRDAYGLPAAELTLSLQLDAPSRRSCSPLPTAPALPT